MPSMLALPARLRHPVDPAVARIAVRALAKLDSVEPQVVLDAPDPRVRLLQMGPDHAAVLFRLDIDPVTWVLHGVFPSAEAAAEARTHRFVVNPHSGTPEVVNTASWVKVDDVDPGTPLGALGLQPATLITRLGIDPGTAHAAAQASNTTALLQVAAQAPTPSQGEALRLAALGTDIDAIRAELELPDQAVGDLREALDRPTTRMNYALYLTRDAEDGEWVLNGATFNQWRTFLHPRQRRYATARTKGPTVINGGAGTGKTVVLVHRAAQLARRYPGSRIVLTTFTTNLANELRDMAQELAPDLPLAGQLGEPGILVCGVDALAWGLMKDPQRVAPAVRAVTGRELGHLTAVNQPWDEALGATPDLPEVARSVAFFEAEYDQVILKYEISELGSYLKVQRRGRVPLDRAGRHAVWEAISTYRDLLRNDDRITFLEAMAIAASHVQDTGPMVDHLLVDEGQDLSLSHWRFLRALTAEGPDDIFVAEDSHQRIYAAKATLDNAMAATTLGTLRLSYRTTSEIITWASKIFDGQSYTNVRGEPTSPGCRATRSGEIPRRIEAESYRDEVREIARVVQSWLQIPGVRPETIGILTLSRDIAESLVTDLAEEGVAVQQVAREAIQPGLPVVMTMHRAKGTEFRYVLLARVDQQWAYRGVTTIDTEDRERRDRSLLYVAATRARDVLAVTWSRRSNPYLPRGDWDTHAPSHADTQVSLREPLGAWKL